VIESELGAAWRPELDDMLREADIVSVNCPHNAESHHLLDARRLGLLGEHGYLINTARGEIVEEGALIEALEAKRIGGAGLDVFEHEPAVDPRLLALDNVVLLPHMGSATFEGRSAMGDKVIANIRAWSDGHRPPDQVLEGWV
jgi:glyoxylate reductase